MGKTWDTEQQSSPGRFKRTDAFRRLGDGFIRGKEISLARVQADA